MVTATTALPSKIVCKLCDKVLNAPGHLLIAVTKGKNVPLALISCPIYCLRWQYVVFDKLELSVVVFWTIWLEAFIFQLVFVVIVIHLFIKRVIMMVFVCIKAILSWLVLLRYFFVFCPLRSALSFQPSLGLSLWFLNRGRSCGAFSRFFSFFLGGCCE